MELNCKVKIISVASPKESGGSINVDVKWWFENPTTGDRVGSKFDETLRFSDGASATPEKIVKAIKKKAKGMQGLIEAADSLVLAVGGVYDVHLGGE